MVAVVVVVDDVVVSNFVFFEIQFQLVNVTFSCLFPVDFIMIRLVI